MTKSKAQKLVQELIEKYGDVLVAKTYDYWASKTYVNEGEDTNTIIAEIHLSEVELPTNRTEFNNLVDIVTGKASINYIPVEIEESKKVYDSPEQVEYHKIATKNAKRMFTKYGNYITYFASPLSKMYM